MLKPVRAGALLAAGALACLAAVARGQDEAADSLRRPERITVGVGDQYLGQLAPDGRTLYFVSNRNTTNEVFQQDVDQGRVRLLFDEGADVTWPRVSPDGRALLYVSFRDSAAGQLCVRDLPAAGARRCLDDPSAALQAEWSGGDRIVLVSRAPISGDLAVSEVAVGRQLAGRALPYRSLISPAISPDGRWLVYVPVERYVQEVGPGFAARAAPRLEAVRLDRPAAPVPLRLDLPGKTGQPAFSRDGRHLYVAQFIGDSNHDGVIDGDDNGVLFRVPFRSDRDDAPALAGAAAPEQLTQASWNCQYPSPVAGQLVFTASRDQHLIVYGLPPDGVVPGDWTDERLALEIELATSRTDEQLLHRHRLSKARTASAQAAATLRLVNSHLELDEHDAAEFYARRLASLPDPDAASLSKPLLLLVEHRKAVRDREQGRAAAGFRESARRRLEAVGTASGARPALAALQHLVRSEIADSLGDKATARAELAAVEVDDALPPAILATYYERADALYRELDDREALVAAGRRLAASRALTPDERCEYARAAVRAMHRGLPLAEADEVLRQERASAPGDSELAFALDLARAVLAVHEKRPPPAVTDALLAVYRRQNRPDRCRAVVFDAVRRAAAFDADEVIEALAQQYVRDLKPGTLERRRAERFYQRVMVGRAFRRSAEGRRDEARDDFEAVTRVTGSLETVVSSLELRLRSGASPAALAAEREKQLAGAPKPLDRFVKAYLLARALPKLEGEEHARTVADALATLRASWKELKRSHVARALFGAILHEDFLRTGDRATAERANTHFMVALDLVRSNPRYRATILGQLALLHTAVGNYRIALRYLEDREKLPFAENSSALAVRLARARALLHVDREEEAAATADQALAMVEHKPGLAAYRVLALDRAALCNLAADRFQRALALYDAELPLLDAASGPAAERNRLVARLARAAAALGAGHADRALADLGAVDARLDDPGLRSTLRWPHVDPEQVVRTYRLMAAGLRANANQKLGRLAEAGRALAAQRELLREQLARTSRDEHLRALTLAEARLADNAADRADQADAARWIGRALDHADSLLARTHAGVDADQLAVLRLAGELGVRARAPIPFDLPKRLGQAHARAGERRDGAWRSHQRWFEIYLTLLAEPEPGERRLPQGGEAAAGGATAVP